MDSGVPSSFLIHLDADTIDLYLRKWKLDITNGISVRVDYHSYFHRVSSARNIDKEHEDE